MRLPRILGPLQQQLLPRYAFTRLGGVAWTGIATTIYATLGIVVSEAGGLSAVSLLVVGIFISLTALTYTELTAMRDGAGRRVANPPGAVGFARAAFDESISFIAGWAVVLDLLLLTAISAEAFASYVIVLMPALGSQEALFAVVASVTLIIVVAVRNGRAPNLAKGVGIRVLLALDAAVLAFLGAALLIEAIEQGLPLISITSGVGVTEAIFAGTLGLLALTGFETVATLSGEARIEPARRNRFLIGFGVGATAALMLAGALGAAHLGLFRADGHTGAPVSALALALEPKWLADLVRGVAAVLAVTTLAVTTNGAMLAVARLSSTMATSRQIPARVGRLSPQYGTPTTVIALVALLTCVLVATLDLRTLVGLYAFGALVALTIVHVAAIRLRLTLPGANRRFRMPASVALSGGRSLPLPALIGAILAAAGWVAVVVLHERAGIVGACWMAAGVLIYIVSRRASGLPLRRTVSVPASALTRDRDEGEFGSVLVPVFGRPLDDDIIQTAGRLARDRALDVEDSGGAQIEAIWVFELPMSLALTGPLDDEALRVARKALARAKAVGEEYEGVTVATATVRARRVGQGIVDEARRRGVEAIVMAAEEPSRVRGGSTLGGTGDFSGRSLGPITTYVLQHAPCRVLLTAPPIGDRGVSATPDAPATPPD